MKPWKRAFTMLEVVLAVLFFTMMTLMVAATIPMAARSSRRGADTVQASSLLMHKIDQLQSAGYAKMNGVDLGGLNIIDNTGSGILNSPDPRVNENGDGTGDAPFTRADNLDAFFANYASQPEGTIELAPYQPSLVVGSSPNRYSVIQATVTVTWRDPRGNPQSVSMRTLIPKAKLQ
jgi:type II secretory pathway pseudopilin PulG